MTLALGPNPSPDPKVWRPVSRHLHPPHTAVGGGGEVFLLDTLGRRGVLLPHPLRRLDRAHHLRVTIGVSEVVVVVVAAVVAAARDGGVVRGPTCSITRARRPRRRRR